MDVIASSCCCSICRGGQKAERRDNSATDKVDCSAENASNLLGSAELKCTCAKNGSSGWTKAHEPYCADVSMRASQPATTMARCTCCARCPLRLDIANNYCRFHYSPANEKNVINNRSCRTISDAGCITPGADCRMEQILRHDSLEESADLLATIRVNRADTSFKNAIPNRKFRMHLKGKESTDESDNGCNSCSSSTDVVRASRLKTVKRAKHLRDQNKDPSTGQINVSTCVNDHKTVDLQGKHKFIIDATELNCKTMEDQVNSVLRKISRESKACERSSDKQSEQNISKNSEETYKEQLMAEVKYAMHISPPVYY